MEGIDINEDERKIWDRLQNVHDPELGASIVDLGLVYSIALKDNIASICMTFTTPLCPFGESLVKNVKHEIMALGFQPKIEIIFEPPWSLDKIKPEIREQFMFPQDVI
jgi:metal-sulfur cluster biosynthetic enzyme